MPKFPEPMMTAAELAKRIQKTTRWTREAAHRIGIGRLFGRDLRFTEADVEIFLASMPTVASTKPQLPIKQGRPRGIARRPLGATREPTLEEVLLLLDGKKRDRRDKRPRGSRA